MQSDLATPGSVRHLASEEGTIAAGRELAAGLAPGAVVALTGDLGAGKTCFAKGIVAGLGCDGDVSSPTFTLLHEYLGGRLPVFHFDFYRLESEQQLWDIGWEEYLEAKGVVIAEWADKFPRTLPSYALWISLGHTRDSDGTLGRELRVLEAAPAKLA